MLIRRKRVQSIKLSEENKTKQNKTSITIIHVTNYSTFLSTFSEDIYLSCRNSAFTFRWMNAMITNALFLFESVQISPSFSCLQLLIRMESSWRPKWCSEEVRNTFNPFWLDPDDILFILLSTLIIYWCTNTFSTTDGLKSLLYEVVSIISSMLF